MFDRLRDRVLGLLRVPPEPHPPEGDPASLRVFRAGRNYFRLRISTWTFAQVLALAGIVFWTVMLMDIQAIARARSSEAVRARSLEEAAKRLEALGQQVKQDMDNAATGLDRTRRGWDAYKRFLVEVALMIPPSAVPLLWVLKVAGILFYLIQLPLTYAVRRLDYELRWYMVTDRSLRLRHGVWRVSESTMSFANIQQVEVTQGPLQRLLGLGDVKVQSAGGGNKPAKHTHEEHDLHVGRFHSVAQAREIRDLILQRLRHFRDAGLGDPDDPGAATTAGAAQAPDPLVAAQQLLAAAQGVRQAIEGGARPSQA